MSYVRFITIWGSVLLLGCPGLGSQEPSTGGEIPENPTWSDVEPVMNRLCSECHSDPPQQMAPPGYRFDVCEDVGDPGAQTWAPRIQIRMIDKLPTPMPPLTYPEQPTPADEELVARWVEQGAPCDGEDGEP